VFYAWPQGSSSLPLLVMTEKPNKENEPSSTHESPTDPELERVMAEAEAAVGSVRAAKSQPGEDEDKEQGPAPADNVPSVEAQLDAARQESIDLRDKWLRSVADFENYKKRAKRDIDDAVHRATHRLLDDFLAVPDNLDRALDVAEDGESQLVQGIRMVMTSFMAALTKHGIEPVEAVGVLFDPAIHDALQQFDSPDFAPGIVMQEFEKGYRRGERLIRPARVVVAGAGSTGASPTSTETEPQGGTGPSEIAD